MWRLKHLITILILAIVASSYHLKLDDKVFRMFHLRIDNSFTEDERLSIEESAHRWERVTKKAVRFDFSNYEIRKNFNPQLEFLDNPGITNSDILETERTIFVWNGKEGTQLQQFESSLGFKVVGMAPGNYMMLVPSRLTTQELQQTATHEIGHIIGLQHSQSIMNAESPSDCITSTDTLQYCKLYQCSTLFDVIPECQ